MGGLGKIPSNIYEKTGESLYTWWGFLVYKAKTCGAASLRHMAHESHGNLLYGMGRNHVPL